MADMNIIELVRCISKRPGLYLSEPTLSHFDTFISGWLFAIGEAGADKAVDPITGKVLKGFQEYIENRYKMGSEHSWRSVIQFYYLSDTRSLEAFFELFEEFLASEDAPAAVSSSSELSEDV